MLRRAPIVAIAAAALITGIAAGCSDDSSDASTQDCRTVTGTAVTLVAKDVQWDIRCLQVQPGVIDFTVDNRDRSVAHNLRVTGHGIDEHTKLVTGPVFQRLPVDLRRPGRYTYVCDIHPNMEGTVTAG